MKKYPISSYNKCVCLKANELMLLISLYLLKPYLIAATLITYREDQNTITNLFYPDKLILSFEAAATIPLLFLVYAWIRKSHNATHIVKKIWHNGKKIIMVTALLQFAVTSSPLWLPTEITMTNSSWAQLILLLLVLIITPLSTYMSDCFADFPEHDEDTTS